MIPGDFEIFALATDTIWGMACKADSIQAVKRIFELKGREKSKPLVLFTDSLEQAKEIQWIPEELSSWLNLQWPGPLTLVSKSHTDQFSHCHPLTKLVGVRIPNHSTPLSIIDKFQCPLAVTSFNLAGEKPMQSPEELLKAFPNSVKRVFGTMQAQCHESIVLRLQNKTLKVLRGTKAQL